MRKKWIFLVPVAAGLAIALPLFVTFIQNRTALQKPLPGSAAVWFKHIVNNSPFTAEDAHHILTAVRERLSGASTLHKLTAQVDTDHVPRIIFLSLSNGEERAHVVIGTGRGIRSALLNGIRAMRDRIPEGYSIAWLKLDIVEKTFPVMTISEDHPLPIGLEQNVGIAFREPRVALMPEEILSSNLPPRGIRLSALHRYLEARRTAERTHRTETAPGGRLTKRYTITHLIPFPTSGFFNDGERTFRLYRGHRIFKQLTIADLIQAARLAGKYLIAATGKDGSFRYIYLPKEDAETHDYNYLRHCGTVVAMLELYRLTGERELLTASSHAIRFFQKQIRPFRIEEDASCLCSEGKVKLGGAGLALLALAQYSHATGDLKHLPLMQQLARYISLEQDAEGRFVHMRTCPGFRKIDFVSEYYPGEAMCGLIALYEIDRNEGWLESAGRSADYLITVRDKGKTVMDLKHDHWLLIALDRLYRHRPKGTYLIHAMRIAQSIMLKQRRKGIPDWVGSYFSPPRSIPAAIRCEALCAAYRLVRDFGDRLPDTYRKSIMANHLLAALHLNMHFQLGTQLRPESAMYLPNPAKGIGGFKESLSNSPIRIDGVQHNLSAVVHFYRILKEEGIALHRSNLSSTQICERIWPYDTVYPEY
jgi:hypothetical protein